ncbi:MAG: hypothetical protein GC202_12120 [Alphaproteobacteria bacterium]|nr:hypothetical protein [Alphaproteobacteria bacterium]
MSGPARASAVFVAAAALAAPVAVAAPNALAVLMAAAALAAAALDPEARRLAGVPRVLICLLAGFLAFAVVSLTWTLDAAEGLDGWIRIAVTAVLGMILLSKARSLDDGHRKRVGDALAGGYAAAILLLLVQIVSERYWGREHSIAALWYPPDTNFWALFNRSATVLVMILPLATLAVYRRHGVRAAIALAAIGGWLTFQLNSQAAEVAVCAGAAAAIFALLAGRLAPRLLAAALVLGMLAAPFAAHTGALADLAKRRDVSVSVYHRAAIWGFTSERIAEKPILGWGMHAARSMPHAKETIAYGAELMPLHPHNGPLHVWLEFGLVGALLAAGLLAWLGLATAGPPPELAMRSGLLAATLVVASVSYGLWQGWWMATLWLVGAFAAAIPATPRDGA